MIKQRPHTKPSPLAQQAAKAFRQNIADLIYTERMQEAWNILKPLIDSGTNDFIIFFQAAQTQQVTDPVLAQELVKRALLIQPYDLASKRLLEKIQNHQKGLPTPFYASASDQRLSNSIARLIRTKDFDEAWRMLEPKLEDTEDVFFLYQAAKIIWLSDNNAREALQYLYKALDIDPEDGICLKLLNKILCNSDEPDFFESQDKTEYVEYTGEEGLINYYMSHCPYE